ncbi:MAG: hypothetical protein RLZZ152_990, partial [Pseudomonadota bacterium]
MLNYLITRLARASLTLFLILTFSFFILRMTGDPAMLIMSPDAPPEALEAFRKGWGLDAPLWDQYLGFLGNLLQGNFGYSMRDKSPAMELVISRIPATLTLAIPAFFLKQDPFAPPIRRGGSRAANSVSAPAAVLRAVMMSSP